MDTEAPTSTWDETPWLHDDWGNAGGVLLFCLQHCFGVRWEPRVQRSWVLFDSLCTFATGTRHGIQLYSRDLGGRMHAAIRLVSVRFATWMGHQFKCCFCYQRPRGLRLLGECIEYPIDAPRRMGLCSCGGHRRRRHARCDYCCYYDEDAREAARESGSPDFDSD